MNFVAFFIVGAQQSSIVSSLTSPIVSGGHPEKLQHDPADGWQHSQGNELQGHPSHRRHLHRRQIQVKFFHRFQPCVARAKAGLNIHRMGIKKSLGTVESFFLSGRVFGSLLTFDATQCKKKLNDPRQYFVLTQVNKVEPGLT